jgi:hypothetical protein
MLHRLACIWVLAECLIITITHIITITPHGTPTIIRIITVYLTKDFIQPGTCNVKNAASEMCAYGVVDKKFKGERT